MYRYPNIEYINDLWMYNISSNEWTWLAGDEYPNVHSSYGAKGIPSDGNIPGSVFGQSMIISPVMDSLIIYGGSFYGKQIAVTTVGLTVL